MVKHFKETSITAYLETYSTLVNARMVNMLSVQAVGMTEPHPQKV
jgi:hypothetical protein